MKFNPLKEKGIPMEKQLRTWCDIAGRKYNKNEIDTHSRTRQILMNGIEVEVWNFKHNLARICMHEDTLDFLAQTKRIEDAQQTTVNWLAPCDQSVLETTLGYEQVAVNLTAWLAQNEDDPYVKETLDFGLLEDFDHLYRYAQWAYMEHGISADNILKGDTNVFIGRPTQHHHNCNIMRLRKHYDKAEATPKTKVNILTVLAGEQQTHNYYGEHGFAYGNSLLRKTYAEIKDVEEEHVTMYESLIDPAETLYEKLLLREFLEVCTYHNCYEDEKDPVLKSIWEEFTAIEIEHLQKAAELFEKYENRDPEEVIGDEVVHPCHFEDQKDYVNEVLDKEIDKRLAPKGEFAYIKDLPETWAGYKIQNIVNAKGAPSETTIRAIASQKKRELVIAEEKMQKEFSKLAERGLQTKGLAPNSVNGEEYTKMHEHEFIL